MVPSGLALWTQKERGSGHVDQISSGTSKLQDYNASSNSFPLNESVCGEGVGIVQSQARDQIHMIYHVTYFFAQFKVQAGVNYF